MPGPCNHSCFSAFGLKRPLCGSESVYAERLTQLRGISSGSLVERRASSVGDAIDRVEEGGYPGSIDGRGLAHFLRYGAAGSRKSIIVRAQHGLRELDQEISIGNPGIAGSAAAGDGGQFESTSTMLAARTEQLRVPGGSIGTLIYCRHPAGQQFDLRMRNRAVFVCEILHRVAWQILMGRQIEKAAGLVRHERERPSNI